MDYAQKQRNPSKHLVGISAVLVVHGLIIYGLANGLGHKALEIIKKPLEATLLEPPKLPPPPPPPPPPEIKKVVMEQPKLAPPPPYIPPPDAPAPVNPNAVVQETVNKPPPVEQVIAPPPPPAPPAPAAKPGPKGVVKGATCSARAKPEYPRKALQEGVSALVVVHISMSKDGVPGNVEVKSNNVSNQALRREFSSAATAAARQFRCESSDEGYILEQEFAFKVEE